ncbi:hypothetical protein [Streptomyces sp. NEAU-H3]|uniref:hypothetical protein n=2 Tax=Streptomyces TaxID=1883 RepID=UPI00280C05E5|nr:hypothetical protein [Streptomyces sp. NEAU-H3]
MTANPRPPRPSRLPLLPRPSRLHLLPRLPPSPPRQPRSSRPRPSRPRLRRLGVLLALAAPLALVVLAVRAAPGEEPDRGLSRTQALACSPYVVEGEVVRTRPAKDEGMSVWLTVRVTRWYKPAAPGAALREAPLRVLVASARETGDEPVEAGEHVLVRTSDRPEADWAELHRADEAVGRDLGRDIAQGRADLRRDLPASADVTCPDWWHERGSARVGDLEAAQNR